MVQQNDFTKGSIPRNILSMAIPMTLAQLVNILYSVVDRMYLGNIEGVGRLALTGLGLCMPVIAILIGFANLCGMGGAPLCSIYRGRGEYETAEEIMGNAFTLLLMFGVTLTVVGSLVKEPLLTLFGASSVTLPYATDYLSIYILGTLFVMISLGMNPFINAQGFGRMGMVTVTVGAATNIILDPIFIFYFDMGVRGAALATIIAQGCSALWVLRFLTGKKAILRLRLKSMKLQLHYVKRILTLGLSSFSIAITNCIAQVVCNTTLQSYGGDLYVGVMTVISAVREVVSMPLMGISTGGQPVTSFNYGAGCYSRVRACVRFITVIIVGYSVVVWSITMFMPELLIGIFNDEAELMEVGVRAFRIYYVGFVFMALQIAAQQMFTALGRAKQAVFFSVLRKIIIVVPLTLILPAIGFGTDGVFWAEFASNIIGGVACYATMIVLVYRPLAHLEDVVPAK